MQYQGVLRKMRTELQSTIQYYLIFENDVLNLNQLIGKKIQLSFDKYECLSCGNDREIFRQGFCKTCFFEAPQAGEWIMHPEKSTAHLNLEDRDLDYEKKMQLQPHIVYLAQSSNAKVGVTRKSQVPTRWIDQGATKALPIMEAPNRYLAGITEVALKQHIADKTNWRKMLQGISEDEDLNEIRSSLKKHIPEESSAFFLAHESVLELNFPIEKPPVKLNSLNLGKTPEYTGTLKGIKGQYLIFEDDTVFNVRNNEGLVVKITVS
ncbi:MAG: DUF2797 domain-containing protein [Flavobacteriaceae bacterium]|nr:DUF2797 domain-containing protein [Flavobacteriaceae bacterium]